MNKNKYLLIISLFAIPAITYFYFLNWKTEAVYGDDLYMFITHSGLHSLSEKIDMLLSVEKYRPIQALSLHIAMELFGKNLDAYYLYNVGIQSINIFIFAALINLFLKSPFFSLSFSLIIGLSRFSLTNTSLVLLGAREGLTMSLFLLSLLFIVKSLVKNDFTASQKQKAIIWSIVFANLSMYTHERYIMMVLFIALLVLFAPDLKKLSLRQRIVLSLIGVGSILLNVIIKKYVYSIPFFVGTEGTHIEFSFSSAFSFLIDAILSIFQINSGPEYLAGISFSSLKTVDKLPAIIVCASLLLILGLYIFKVWKSFSAKQKDSQLKFPIFFSMLILCGLFLAPAVATIRLEQRWLQVSFSVFILMVIIALSTFTFKNNYLRNWLFSLFILCFIGTNFIYLYKGANIIYMINAERIAAQFKKASGEGVIHPKTNRLYIWEKQRNARIENEMIWSLANGYNFDFYQGKKKELIFVDSVYEKLHDFQDSTLKNFDPKTSQIIYVSEQVNDITVNFLKDSLKNFKPDKLDNMAHARKVQYNQRQLLITNNDFDKFSMSGFHAKETRIRWTNGHAGIGFMGNYTIGDSLSLQLNTFMPAVCKGIIPAIKVIGTNNKKYEATLSRREGDKFNYIVHVDTAINIQKIEIVSDTIDASPDKRTLSFPFISLELKQ
jgi:hypothetical protein